MLVKGECQDSNIDECLDKLPNQTLNREIFHEYSFNEKKNPAERIMNFYPNPNPKNLKTIK